LFRTLSQVGLGFWAVRSCAGHAVSYNCYSSSTNTTFPLSGWTHRLRFQPRGPPFECFSESTCPLIAVARWREPELRQHNNRYRPFIHNYRQVRCFNLCAACDPPNVRNTGDLKPEPLPVGSTLCLCPYRRTDLLQHSRPLAPT
jgi:hypothetical protein